MVTRLIQIFGSSTCGFARLLAKYRLSRTALNYVYLRLAYSRQNFVHSCFAKIFENTDSRVQPGTWRVAFAGREILLPLSSERIWLDWDLALSLVGHDIEVVKTYEALLCPASKPDLLIDIGANYGTHSLLFLVHGVRSLTFEPNSSCHGVFKEHCALNHVADHVEPVALGASDGTVTLRYPEKNTWWGSTTGKAAPGTEGLELELKEEEVAQRRLDSYSTQIAQELEMPLSNAETEVGSRRQPRVLIKIDTEGSECEVLQGATSIIERYKPLIIFECFPGESRKYLMDFFRGIHYEVFPLPWSPLAQTQPLPCDGFLTSRDTNFMAVFTGRNGKEDGDSHHV